MKITSKAPLVWPWAAAVALVAAISAIQVLDASDLEAHQTITQEHYEWLDAARQCITKYGPATQPEYVGDDNKLACVTRRGEVLALGGGK